MTRKAASVPPATVRYVAAGTIAAPFAAVYGWLGLIHVTNAVHLWRYPK